MTYSTPNTRTTRAVTREVASATAISSPALITLNSFAPSGTRPSSARESPLRKSAHLYRVGLSLGHRGERLAHPD